MTLTSRPLTVMTLTSRHNVQALDSDDPDIQRQRSGPWQWWLWHPGTLTSALDSEIQTQPSGPWQWWLWHPAITFRHLTVMSLTSNHNDQALDCDDFTVTVMTLSSKKRGWSLLWQIVWNLGNSSPLEGYFQPFNLCSQADNVPLDKSSINWVIPAGTRRNFRRGITIVGFLTHILFWKKVRIWLTIYETKLTILTKQAIKSHIIVLAWYR